MRLQPAGGALPRLGLRPLAADLHPVGQLVQLGGKGCQLAGDVDLLGTDSSAGTAAQTGVRPLVRGHRVQLHLDGAAAAGAELVVLVQQIRDIQLLGTAVTAVAAGSAGDGILHLIRRSKEDRLLSGGEGVKAFKGGHVIRHLRHVGHPGEDHVDVIQSLEPAEAEGGDAGVGAKGVELLLDIYENYGCVYASGVFICDKDEVWYIENCSGTQYVAIKLNDNMIFLEPNMAVIGRVDLDDENVIASKDLIAVAKKAGTFVGDEAKNIIDFRASYARISEKMDQRMIDGLNYLNATYKYDSDALVADNTKFTISNLDASDKLVALYTNIKADRKLDKDDVFGYYKLSSIGKASNQEIEIFQLFKDRPVETATVGWVGVSNMSYNVFVPYYPMLIDSMYKGYQVSTASAKFTTEKPDTFCTYGTSWAQDAEGNWQRVSGFKAYPSNWKDSYYFTFEGLGGYIANADKITGKPLKAEAKAYVADQLAALQQELYKDFVTTDQLAKADDARALATENGKTMAEKAHKLGVELVEYITKDEALQPSVFTDVKEGAYYVDAVNWAVDKKVTSGKTETTFAPNDSCTRAQAVTFLWRAAGSLEPTASEMTFTDVKADSYYDKAVLWAVENKITSGMSDTLFAPDATCSRSQIVTFLYRMQNSPESKAENPFTDVKADAYYANAVLWAVENGVTTGASATTFDPAGDCTRGQIVTFLYRCLSK